MRCKSHWISITQTQRLRSLQQPCLLPRYYCGQSVRSNLVPRVYSQLLGCRRRRGARARGGRSGAMETLAQNKTYVITTPFSRGRDRGARRRTGVRTPFGDILVIYQLDWRGLATTHSVHARATYPQGRKVIHSPCGHCL